LFELPTSPLKPPSIFELPVGDAHERSAPPAVPWKQQQGKLSPSYPNFPKISMDGTLQHTHSAADLSALQADSMLSSKVSTRRIGGFGEKKFISDVQNSTIAELPAEPLVFVRELEANPIYEIGPSPSRESVMKMKMQQQQEEDSISENVLKEVAVKVKPAGNFI